MGTMVETLVPLQLQRTLSGLLVVGEETELDLSKGEERHGKGAMTGASQGARQHGGRRSKETGQRCQQAQHVNPPWNLVKECREREAGSAARLDQIKEPAPEEVIPTFRTLLNLECSVGLGPQSLQDAVISSKSFDGVEASVPN